MSHNLSQHANGHAADHRGPQNHRVEPALLNGQLAVFLDAIAPRTAFVDAAQYATF